MTLRYHRGMTLGEFEEMIAKHHRAESASKGLPPAASVECDHPFEQAGMSISAVRVEGGVEIRSRYECPACGAKWGVRKLLPSRKAKVEASE